MHEICVNLSHAILEWNPFGRLRFNILWPSCSSDVGLMEVFNDCPAFHHKADILQQCDIAKGIASNGN